MYLNVLADGKNININAFVSRLAFKTTINIINVVFFGRKFNAL